MDMCDGRRGESIVGGWEVARIYITEIKMESCIGRCITKTIGLTPPAKVLLQMYIHYM